MTDRDSSSQPLLGLPLERHGNSRSPQHTTAPSSLPGYGGEKSRRPLAAGRQLTSGAQGLSRGLLPSNRHHHTLWVAKGAGAGPHPQPRADLLGRCRGQAACSQRLGGKLPIPGEACGPLASSLPAPPRLEVPRSSWLLSLILAAHQ